MVRRRLALLAVCLSACGQASDRPEVHVASGHETVAWVGEQGSLTIVAEYLTQADDPANAVTSEIELIREQLPEAERRAYLRVHLFGEPGSVDRDLVVQLPQQDFVGFAAASEELSQRQALLWEAMLRGRPIPATTDQQAVQRSLVLSSEGPALDPATPALVWQSGADHGDLTRRSWSQVARREYFEAVVQPPAAESEESP